MRYVIGVDGGATKCLLKAKDMQGNLLAEVVGNTTNHLVVGVSEAGRRVVKHVASLLSSFKGRKEDCACIVIGAAGIDSPNDRVIVDGFYNSLLFGCPICCMNDGNVALYATTRGLGILAISGTGSIVVGRNQNGKVTRSGGYPSTIFGNEGSSQWIALYALYYASKWVDGSVESSPLIEKMHDYFHGLDANKLVECSVALRRRPVDSQLAVLVYEAAKSGDSAAENILRRGAMELLDVAETCVKKLGFGRGDEFLSGVWGSVFVKNEIFYDYYRNEFIRRYPGSKVIFPNGDAADGAVQLAFDYLGGKVDFMNDL
jgi:N-acetylglucosamine kinase-like BadF-type ATPase